ncbi:MAG: hypothetical protein JXR37_28275 [Kiritimatiellae bacterium]|nr:hypothetical protein [Kiritimatiellia bacterium]
MINVGRLLAKFRYGSGPKLPPQTGTGTPARTLDWRHRRTRQDFVGYSNADAFNYRLSYRERTAPLRKFYAACRQAQKAAALTTDATPDASFSPKVKVQLDPCYTTYPAACATGAAIGLTAYREYTARLRTEPLVDVLVAAVRESNPANCACLDPDLYRKLICSIAESVAKRLLLHELAAQPKMAAVETYRLFSASQQDLRFHSVAQILNAVILWGDVLPDWSKFQLHPTTAILLEIAGTVSGPFVKRLEEGSVRNLKLGTEWVLALAVALAPFVANRNKPDDVLQARFVPQSRKADLLRFARPRDREEDAARSDTTSAPDPCIRPLNSPPPPQIESGSGLRALPGTATPDPLAPREMLDNRLEPDSQAAQALQQSLNRLGEAADQASGQTREWEDIRSDLIDRRLAAPFSEARVQGDPTAGHEVLVPLGKGRTAVGELSDCAAPLSEDVESIQKLRTHARPIADALKRVLYPNVQQIADKRRFRTTGLLDPSRLAVADFSNAVFRQTFIQTSPDPRGKPLLVIACDMSSSLDRTQSEMVKILAAAWLEATTFRGIRVLAALYHSGSRAGVSGPLVQWVYHPIRTIARNPRDAVRALAAIDKGTGRQSDALSLAYILGEARAIARGSMTYLIVISDCEFNASLEQPDEADQMKPVDEVTAVLRNAREESGGGLHTTLAALDVSGDTGLEPVVDKVIKVDKDNLQNGEAVAQQISTYVASCMKERRALIRKK